MIQMKLSELWFLKEGDEVEVNEKKFEVMKVYTIEEDQRDREGAQKVLILDEDHFLEINEEGVCFGKRKQVTKHTDDYSEVIEIKSLKVLKKLPIK